MRGDGYLCLDAEVCVKALNRATANHQSLCGYVEALISTDVEAAANDDLDAGRQMDWIKDSMEVRS